MEVGRHALAAEQGTAVYRIDPAKILTLGSRPGGFCSGSSPPRATQRIDADYGLRPPKRPEVAPEPNRPLSGRASRLGRLVPLPSGAQAAKIDLCVSLVLLRVLRLTLRFDHLLGQHSAQGVGAAESGAGMLFWVELAPDEAVSPVATCRQDPERALGRV